MKDSILTSTEFTDKLQNLHNLMCKSKQRSIEMVYQKFQIDNFSIEQVFRFIIKQNFPDSSDKIGIMLKNRLDITILPYNYFADIYIDSINLDDSADYYNHPLCDYIYRPHRLMGDDKIIDNDRKSLFKLAHHINAYKYSLLQIDYSKLMNLIDLASVKCI